MGVDAPTGARCSSSSDSVLGVVLLLPLGWLAIDAHEVGLLVGVVRLRVGGACIKKSASGWEPSPSFPPRFFKVRGRRHLQGLACFCACGGARQ